MMIISLADVTCREEILAVVRHITELRGDDKFDIAEVLEEMRRRESKYGPPTIRTHVSSIMTINAPVNHAHRTSDFEALGGGVYRLLARDGKDE